MSKINLKELYKTDKDFLNDLDKLSKDIKEYSKYENKLFSSGKFLYEFLEFDTNISKRLESLHIYAHVNNDLDLDNTKYQEYYGMVMNLYHSYMELSSYVIPEILSHSYKEFLSLLDSYPRLSEYKLNIKRVFRDKKLVLSKKEEKLITYLTSTYNKPEEISEMLINTDLNYGTIRDEKGKDVLLTNSNYSTYLESGNRDIRKDAFNALYDEISSHSNTFASVFSTNVINDNKVAKLRKFKSARDLSLYHNEVDPKIYDSLIKGVHDNLKIFYKYYDFKQKVLGLKEFHLYDAPASITSSYDKKYSYEDAKNIVLDSLSIMGKDYISVLSKAFNNSWIDSEICKTKRSGAYCTCAYATHPYVVTSFEGKLNDVSTIAHELGHAMHYYYAMTNNTYQDYNYSIFVAEVASQVNEVILTDYLLKKSNDIEEKKYLLDQMLNRYKATIIRQTMFAEFEDLVHNAEYNGTILTKDYLTNEYYKLNKLYFGKNVTVDEKIKYECFRIPHFYYNFYVYQYATGYIAALKIANDLINGKKGALEGYLKFLKLGSTLDPVKSLKVAGVDIEDENLYGEVFGLFSKRLKELMKLYE